MKFKFTGFLLNVFLIICICAAAFTAFNIISGYKPFAVVTNSMKPFAVRGDAVFVKPAQIKDIKTGDVVTVRYAGGGGYFTHRVTSVDFENEIFTTRGDANSSEDPQPAQASQLVGKVRYTAPLLGWFSIFFSRFGAVKISVVLALAATVLILAGSLISKIKSRGDKIEQN